MPSNLAVTLVNAGTPATLTFIGGTGLPTNPYEWRITDSNPIFAQPWLHTYRRSVGKDVDQLVAKLRMPYTITDSTTAVVSSPAFGEATLTLNLPRTVPQSVIDGLCNLSSTILRTVSGSGLLTPFEARQAG